MASRWARVGRGLLAAGIATFVAAFFHVAGGGAGPSLLATALSLGFSGMACVLLTGKRLALWRLTLSVVLSQFLFHALFLLSPAGSISGPAPGEHLHPGTHLVMVADAGSAATGGMNHDGGLMWVSHAVAALVTIVALRLGEKTFWDLCNFVGFPIAQLLFRGPAESIIGPAGIRVAVLSRPDTLPAVDLVVGSMRHRGPPSGSVSFG